MNLAKVVFFLLFLIFGSSYVYGETFKSEHFTITASPTISASWNKSVLRKAEYHYDRISRRLGFSKYSNYWTWEDRVNIKLYADQKEFMAKTNQPAWAIGGAQYGHRFSQGRSIISFKQEQGFLNGILPHEISHLILRDFIGYDKTIPLWFDEGVAQLFEEGKPQKAHKAMKDWVRVNKPIPFNQLFKYDVRYETNPLRVSIYYAQCLTIVDYMIKIHGSNKFAKLCRAMKDGKPFDQALLSTYKLVFNSVEDFEKKWLSYMKTY